MIHINVPVSRIAQKSIETIKHQVNLLDVVSPYVQLKQSGRSWKGLSPFTQEKTPSFYVHPDRGFYKCFSTGEGGDCFTFIMKVENLEFAEAIEFIAKKFNIPLEYDTNGPSSETVSLRRQLFEIHEIATAWFHHQFTESEEAATVRDYWQTERGFSQEIANEIKIGYAPATSGALAQHLNQQGISAEAMRQSGLFYGRSDEPVRDVLRLRSRFRGRLIIPIRDIQSRVVAFTARKLEQLTPKDDPTFEAKYVNSPETPIFHKGRILFGLDHARKHLTAGGNFLLVEGQLDAIRCWSVGLNTAVAPQGTAITNEQLQLMRRYQPKCVECLLDGDKAGRNAALRILPLAFEVGLDFQFLLLPEKSDPDDLLRKYGKESLEPLRKNSKNAIELAVSEYLPEDRLPNTTEKIAALDKIYALLDNVSSDIVKEDYISIAAGLLKVKQSEDLHTHLIALKNRKSRFKKESVQQNQQINHNSLLTDGTWELLWHVLRFPELNERISDVIDYEWINKNSKAAHLLQRIIAEIREDIIQDSSNIEHLIETVEDRALLADLHSKDLEVDSPEKSINTYLNYMYRNYLNNEISKLKQQVVDAPPDDQRDLMRQIVEIRNQLAKAPELKI